MTTPEAADHEPMKAGRNRRRRVFTITESMAALNWAHDSEINRRGSTGTTLVQNTPFCTYVRILFTFKPRTRAVFYAGTESVTHECARPYKNARVRNIFNALSKYAVKRVYARNLYENKPIELRNRPPVGKNTYERGNDKSNVHACLVHT